VICWSRRNSNKTRGRARHRPESEKWGPSFVPQVGLSEADFQFELLIEAYDEAPGRRQPQRRPQECMQRLQPTMQHSNPYIPIGFRHRE